MKTRYATSFENSVGGKCPRVLPALAPVVPLCGLQDFEFISVVECYNLPLVNVGSCFAECMKWCVRVLGCAPSIFCYENSLVCVFPQSAASNQPRTSGLRRYCIILVWQPQAVNRFSFSPSTRRKSAGRCRVTEPVGSKITRIGK
jgi:hypothetical protein